MRKGFTLIELLAVIVILAIIALIATPIVLDIINDSKESAVLSSAEFYVGALQNEIALENTKIGGTLNPKKCIISGDIANCDGVTLKVKVDEEVPISGIITFDEGKIKRVSLNYANGSVMTGTKGTLVFKKETLEEIAAKKYKEYEEKVAAGSAEVQNKTVYVWVKEQLEKEGIYSNDVVVYEDGRVIVGVSKIASRLFDAGVPIGSTITGYDISTNPIKSYTTDGKENTKNANINKDEDLYNPNPQTVNVAKKLSWSYMGISNEGEALIVLDLNDSTVADADASGVYSTMALGGIGGWFNGVNALNKVCDALYSTSKGKARSINYEDLLTGLKWDGPIAEYKDEAGNTVRLNEVKTIGDVTVGSNTLKSESSAVTYATPDYPIYYKFEDDKHYSNIDSYKIEYIMPKIKKSDGTADVDSEYVKADETAINVVLGTQDINYWVADTCAGVNFKSNKAAYYMRRANYKNISGYTLAESLYYFMYDGGKKIGIEHYAYGTNGKVVVRPVVELFDNLEFTYDDSTNTLNLN